MTNKEKRAALVAKIKSREGKNQYTQSSKRDQVSQRLQRLLQPAAVGV